MGLWIGSLLGLTKGVEMKGCIRGRVGLDEDGMGGEMDVENSTSSVALGVGEAVEIEFEMEEDVRVMEGHDSGMEFDRCSGSGETIGNVAFNVG